ncbi:PAS domain S-box protein [Haloplanus ruber]|uniref:histidine kinase n=1 Tax=Haloplanus ruber TaxID=869892 RepID=A0ABD6CZ83_9EURY|nr:PAS domain S-box protein [Haloplanus ruber]
MTPSTDRITVLHVDDDPAFADMAATFLEREDDRFDVETAVGASEGLELLGTMDVDCIVSDYDMPKRNGLEFLDAVRAEHPDLPFILFTGKGSEEIASQAISAGVTDYLQKGGGTGQYTVLANRIANAVEQYRSQRELEASQQRLSLFIEQSPLGVLEYNSDFEIVRLNDAAEEILGYTEAELRGETWETIVADDSYDSVEAVTAALAETEGGYHSIDENVRKDGEHIVCEWHNRVITDAEGAVVAVFSQFQDVTERRERRRRIEALHEATRELMAADTSQAVAERAVETARDVLDLQINSVYLYDEAADALVPAAVTDEAIELIGEPPTYEPGESLSWEAFRTGEVRVFEDVSDEPGRYNPETAFGAEIILPLGDHGVMYAAATEAGAFDESDVTLARTLAANTEEALSRIERERTLRESRRRYRTLVEQFPDGAVFLFDENREFVLAGGAELDTIGLDPGSFIGRTVTDVFGTDVSDAQDSHYRAALDGEERVFEQLFGGEWYRVHIVPVDHLDSTEGMVVVRNVTEQKEYVRRLETLISNLPGMTYRCRNEPGWPMEDLRGEVEALTGYTADELESDAVNWGKDVLHPADREKSWEAVQDALEDGDSFEVTYRIRTADGTIKWLWERGRAVFDADGEPTVLEGFITDITERKEREATLRAERKKIRRLFETSPVGIIIVDPDGSIRRANERAEAILGLSRATITDRTYDDAAWGVVDENGDPVPRSKHPARRVLETGEPVMNHELGIDRPDGERRWLSVNAAPVTTADGEVEAVVGAMMDVTERRERESELRRRTAELETTTSRLRAQYRRLFEEAPVMAVVTRAEDDTLVIEDCNRLFAETVGYDRADVIGRELASFYTADSRRRIHEDDGDELVTAGELVRTDRKLRTADGDVVETLLRSVPRRDGETTGTLTFYIDVSERRELEREKERLDEFTSIVSHDLRTPLNVAQGQAKLAQEACEAGHDNLDSVIRAHERMETLIDDLLTLARSGTGIDDVEPVALDTLAETCWATVETGAAELVVATDRTIKADQSRLRQLLENLIRNSVEHGSTGNRTVSGNSEGSDTPQDAGHATDPGRGANVTVTVGTLDDDRGFYVADDGPGIPAAERTNVFEAGYSTAADGTGFGLSIVDGVAEAHGWDVSITESAAGGARFEITGVEFVA